MTTLASIALFVYNRPYHTRQAVEFLRNNQLASKSRLIIFSDGPKNKSELARVQEVRDYLKTVKGFLDVAIIERENNHGLANSIISGVSDVINECGKVIVMEDDLISTENFLEFMNGALDAYEDNKKIFSVAGYSLPIKIPRSYPYNVYIAYRSSSWGWGTWRDRWNKVDWAVKDFDDFAMNKRTQSLFNRGGDDLTGMLIDQIKGQIDSWGIRWCYAHFRNNAYCLYPVNSKIQNIGFDGSGVHCGVTDKYFVKLDQDLKGTDFPKDLDINRDIAKAFARLFKTSKKSGVVSRLRALLYK